jgi:hypothetical protein
MDTAQVRLAALCGNLGGGETHSCASHPSDQRVPAAWHPRNPVTRRHCFSPSNNEHIPAASFPLKRRIPRTSCSFPTSPLALQIFFEIISRRKYNILVSFHYTDPHQTLLLSISTTLTLSPPPWTPTRSTPTSRRTSLYVCYFPHLKTWSKSADPPLRRASSSRSRTASRPPLSTTRPTQGQSSPRS